MYWLSQFLLVITVQLGILLPIALFCGKKKAPPPKPPPKPPPSSGSVQKRPYENLEAQTKMKFVKTEPNKKSASLVLNPTQEDDETKKKTIKDCLASTSSDEDPRKSKEKTNAAGKKKVEDKKPEEKKDEKNDNKKTEEEKKEEEKKETEVMGSEKEKGGEKKKEEKKDETPGQKEKSMKSEKKEKSELEPAKTQTLATVTSKTPGLLLSLSATTINWTEAGGQQTIKVTNNSPASMIAVKIKCSDNKLFVVTPVFSTIAAGKTLNVVVTRAPGPVQQDKLVVCWANCTEGDNKDLAAYFKKPNLALNTQYVRQICERGSTLTV